MLHHKCNSLLKVVIHERFYQLHPKAELLLDLSLLIDELGDLLNGMLHLMLPCVYLHHVANMASCSVDIDIICAYKVLYHVPINFLDHIIINKHLDLLLCHLQLNTVRHICDGLGPFLALSLYIA